MLRRLAIAGVVYAFGSLIAFLLKPARWFPQQSEREMLLGHFLLWAGIALGVVVFLAIGMAVARFLVPFVCPRCEQPFFEGLFMEVGFTKRCVCCGLAVGSPAPLIAEPGDPDRAAEDPPCHP